MPREFDRTETYKRLIDAFKTAEDQCSVLGAIDENPSWVKQATILHNLRIKTQQLANSRRTTKLFDALGRPIHSISALEVN